MSFSKCCGRFLTRFSEFRKKNYVVKMRSKNAGECWVKVAKVVKAGTKPATKKRNKKRQLEAA